MKKLLIVALLFTTGCAATHQNLHTPVARESTSPHVFLAYGPNGVGYETIIDTTLDDMNIPLGCTLACNFVLPDHRHILLEGVMLEKEPLFLLATTRLGLMPVQATDEQIEFCLISESQLSK